MFRKEGSASNGKKETSLRRSDMRKLRDRFLEDYQEPLDTQTSEIIQDAFGCASTNATILRSKVRIHGDTITIFVRCPTSSNIWPYIESSQPILIEMETTSNQPILIPHLSLLSILPNYLPNVIIPSPASKYICRGADLMKAGVIQLPSRCPSGSIVSISVYGNPQPFAVGTLTSHSDEMSIGPGTKGVAVKILFSYGDDLWKLQCPKQNKSLSWDNGHYNNPGFINGEIVLPLEEHAEDNDDNKDDNSYLENNNDVNTALSSKVEDINIHEPNLNQTQLTTDDTQIHDPQISEQTIHEELLLNAFYKAIVVPNEPISLPLPVSVFYAKHILPARPPNTTIDLKKTRYKKIGIFLLEQAETGIISVEASKDKKDKVAFLSAIDKSNIQFRTIKKQYQPITQSKATKIAIVSLYCIPAHFIPILRLNKDDVNATNAKSVERRGTGYLTRPECVAILNQYIESENLMDTYDPAEIILNGPLCDTLYKQKKKTNTENFVYPTGASRKDINDKWMAHMEKAHAIVRMPGNEILSMKRGEPSKILITVTRGIGAKRFITRVRGMEEVRLFCISIFLCSSSFFVCNLTTLYISI